MSILSGENNALIDETASNTGQTPHSGILKNTSDENTTKPIENTKPRIGLFSYNFDDIYI